MVGLQAIQSVQYVTVSGKRLVILDAEEWDALMELLEDSEDIALARRVDAEMEAAGGDPEAAGYVRWEDVERELR